MQIFLVDVTVCVITCQTQGGEETQINSPILNVSAVVYVRLRRSPVFNRADPIQWDRFHFRNADHLR